MSTTSAAPAIALILTLHGTAIGQVSWTQKAINGPSARVDHALAYDSLRSATVLFGGQSGGQLGDTWEWTGSLWTPKLFSNSPGARKGHAMTYDSQRNASIMFGGFGNGSLLGDTWEWNGTSWSHNTSNGPSARLGHDMVYDNQRGVVVLFGGMGSSIARLADTWEWNGSSWAQRAATGPTGRYEHAMAYDTQRGKTVLFGGYASSNLRDTWEWDGAAWTQRSNSGPAARAFHAMTYDSQRGVAVVFGGFGNSNLSDTWEWSGSNWAQRISPGPSARNGHAMTYDSQRGMAVLFGGLVANSASDDTWELGNNSPPLAFNFGTGCGPLGLTANPTAMPSLGAMAQANVTNCPLGLGAMTIGWSRTSLGSYSLPLALDGYGAPGCFLLTSSEQAFGLVSFTGNIGTYSIAIPAITQLIGTKLFLQAHAFAPGYNAAQIMLSYGLEWTIGN